MRHSFEFLNLCFSCKTHKGQFGSSFRYCGQCGIVCQVQLVHLLASSSCQCHWCLNGQMLRNPFCQQFVFRAAPRRNSEFSPATVPYVQLVYATRWNSSSSTCTRRILFMGNPFFQHSSFRQQQNNQNQHLHKIGRLLTRKFFHEKLTINFAPEVQMFKLKLVLQLS